MTFVSFRERYKEGWRFFALEQLESEAAVPRANNSVLLMIIRGNGSVQFASAEGVQPTSGVGDRLLVFEEAPTRRAGEAASGGAAG
ncbi:MAG TPA: hypothetical protein VIZ17_09770 [Acetobacteraceae bacterium]